LCYTTKFDKKRVSIQYAFEDTINYLSDFIYEEEPLYGPECFVPEVKLVFRYNTYVISMYCSKVLKYKNSAAFVTSARRMKNDLILTQSVYDYLQRLRQKHFGSKKPNQALLAKVITSEPFEEPEKETDELDLLIDEDMEEDDASDLEIEDTKRQKTPLEDEKDPLDDEDAEVDEDEKGGGSGNKRTGRTMPKVGSSSKSGSKSATGTRPRGG
ncbi:MAG: hypothetical protein AAF206_13875, partial [Bacteroidota bacterium]